MPTHPTQLAIVSDVHGNVTAFEAVLADIDARGIERIVNLGDVVGKGPRGSEAVKLSRQRCAVTVRGNWDSFISDEAIELGPDTQWTREELTSDDLEWLAGLPGSLDLRVSGRHVRLFHASQVSEFHRVRRQHTSEEFRAMFTNTDFTGHGPCPTVVGYGDIHRTYLETNEGLTLFNAGSVGNHLDAPTASYAVLTGELDGSAPGPFGIEFVRVPYDIEAEVAAARDLGLPDVELYAVELREGVYRGDQRRRGG
ncbi:MAG TPA: metallophosphoesterase family protein [Intrasporangium sp.]|uniref:metallophosphoesterase family protein n=1 Tax=Intrasporangium sp. TaxID=1925024 RepID=UPI002D781435|nr:metallophosphoesterase family protein [Intrasporangium sp.]HET7397463.1 metallophosphoesterase family protein [Intrasporangium sp.]